MPLNWFKKGDKQAIDPVCDMSVTKKPPPGGVWNYRGKSYYFCGPGCKKAFQNEAEDYLSGRKKIDM